MPHVTRMRLSKTDGSHSRTRKLTREDAQAIWDLKGKQHVVEVAKLFGITRNTVDRIWNGSAWREINRDGK